MQLTVKRSALLDELLQLQRVVPTKTGIMALQSVLLDANGSLGRLNLAATDLDTSLRSSCAADVAKPGRICLPAKKLTEIVRSLPDGDAVLKESPDAWMSIECERVKFKIAGLPADDFPALPEPESKGAVEIPAAVLADLIARTAFAITQEDARYFMAGASVELEPASITMVTTDGHRLAFARKVTELKLKEPQRVFIPRKTIAELAKLATGEGVVGFQESGMHQRFEIDRRLLTSKTVEAKFPDYIKQLGSELPHVATIDREAFATAVQRVALLAQDNMRSVKLTFTAGALMIEASSANHGEATETLTVEYDGPKVAIGFNARYITDTLAASSAKQVTVSLKDGESVMLLRPAGDETDSRYLTMPVRL